MLAIAGGKAKMAPPTDDKDGRCSGDKHDGHGAERNKRFSIGVGPGINVRRMVLPKLLPNARIERLLQARMRFG